MADITIRKRSLEDAVITQRKFFKKTAKGKVIKGLPCFPIVLRAISSTYQ
jgi:hypothetical protein